jgi:hypothetical protein
LEQCESSVCGFMSTMLTMLPSSRRNAADSGSSVFFIQKHCTLASSKMKSMPSWSGMVLRNIKPIWRCSGARATCAAMR